MTLEEPDMTLEELAGTLGGTGSCSGGGSWARPTVDVRPDAWRSAVRAARDELGYRFFDWLSAVDEQPDGYRIVVHLWSVEGRCGVLIRTMVDRGTPAIASIVDLYPGAEWHERETHEMFGIDFPGHPGVLSPLLLPAEFEGHPLRKDFVLATRVAKPWPGEKEPEDRSPDGGRPSATRRAPLRPPGVPDESWATMDRAATTRATGGAQATGGPQSMGGAQATGGAHG